MGLGSFEQHGDGVLSALQIHGSGNGGTPSTVRPGGGGEQRVAVKFDQEFKSYETVSVDRIEIVQTAADFPCISTGRIDSILKQKGHPRTMGEEERGVAFTCTIIALRCDFSDQRLVSEIKDVWHQPVKGEVAS